jgi:hypothetical protein
MGADPQAIEAGTRVGITFAGAGTLDGVVAAVGDGWWHVDVEGSQRGADGALETVQRRHLVNLAAVAYVRVG